MNTIRWRGGEDRQHISPPSKSKRPSPSLHGSPLPSLPGSVIHTIHPFDVRRGRHTRGAKPREAIPAPSLSPWAGWTAAVWLEIITAKACYTQRHGRPLIRWPDLTRRSLLGGVQPHGPDVDAPGLGHARNPDGSRSSGYDKRSSTTRETGAATGPPGSGACELHRVPPLRKRLDGDVGRRVRPFAVCLSRRRVIHRAVVLQPARLDCRRTAVSTECGVSGRHSHSATPHRSHARHGGAQPRARGQS
jgi:hypothetical protein